MSIQAALYAGHADTVLAAPYDTGGGGATLPGNLHASAQTIINWVCGVVAVIGVLGALYAAGSMIAAHSGHGQAPAGVQKLGWVFGGLLVAGVAGVAVNTVYG